MTEGSVPVLAETYSLLVAGFKAVRLPRSAFKRVDDGIGVGVDHRDRARTAVHGIDTAIARIDRQVLDVGAGLEHDHGCRWRRLTIFTTPRSGNAAYALPLRVLTTTPFGTVRDADLRRRTPGASR